MTELKKKITENEHYELWVASLPDTPTDIYAIVNKEHGVVEMSTSVLYHARKMLTSLNEWESGKEPQQPHTDQLPEIFN